MVVSVGGKAPSDFTEPLELLKECHRRIERFVGVLARVAREVRGGPLPGQHREALEAALRYFQLAGVRHVQDEEQSLFPRVRASHDAQAQAVMAALDDLQADHVSAQVAHERVEAICRQWLAEDRLPRPLAEDLVAIVERLEEVYRRHIELEDQQIFPLAGRVLNGGDLEAIGREMALRREQKTRTSNIEH